MQTGDPTRDSLFYPIARGVKPLSVLPSLSRVKTQMVNPIAWGGARETAIDQWFIANIMQ